MTLANRLTILRIMLIPLFVICVTKMGDEGYEWMVYAALGVFVFTALTDAFDGMFARHRHEVTQLGTYLDPLADKMLMTTACVLLSTVYWPRWSRLLWFTPVIVISRDVFLLLGALIIFLVNGRLRLQPNIAGKITTVAQAVMIVYVLFCQSLYTALNAAVPSWMRPSMWVVQWVVIGWTIVSWLSYTYVGSKQLHEHGTSTTVGAQNSSSAKALEKK
jgi:CDP-diacylglycerol--glycerol-3-phosphate 3-phosphatidyltransferase